MPPLHSKDLFEFIFIILRPRALCSLERQLHLIHLCVGPYNTWTDEHGQAKTILSGVAVDLETRRIFPASFEWNNFEDMTEQIKNMVLRRGGQKIVGEERIAITKLSTFKPKPLRSPAPSKDTLYTQGNVLPSKKK